MSFTLRQKQKHYLDLTHILALLPGLREPAARRGTAVLPSLRLQHLPLRAQRHAQGNKSEVSKAERSG